MLHRKLLKEEHLIHISCRQTPIKESTGDGNILTLIFSKSWRICANRMFFFA
uniref:Uncharacterized protein n=1 Tax=Rhizophora mucronata TaxID=61149 RepID=A0A2P2MCK9_RHIMU